MSSAAPLNLVPATYEAAICEERLTNTFDSRDFSADVESYEQIPAKLRLQQHTSNQMGRWSEPKSNSWEAQQAKFDWLATVLELLDLFWNYLLISLVCVQTESNVIYRQTVQRQVSGP